MITNTCPPLFSLHFGMNATKMSHSDKGGCWQGLQGRGVRDMRHGDINDVYIGGTAVGVGRETSVRLKEDRVGGQTLPERGQEREEWYMRAKRGHGCGRYT
jgi:hypothetical protein